MFKTLYNKLAAVFFILFCLMGILYISTTLITNKLLLQEGQQKLNSHLAQHISSEKLLIEDGKINKKALKEMFHMMMVVNPSIELYLLSPEGKILSYSAPDEKIKRENVSLSSIEKFLKEGSSFPILGDDPRHPNRKKVFSAAPVINDGTMEGYIYVILGGEIYDSVATMLKGSYILRLSLLTGAFALVFILLTGLFLFKQLTERLGKLTKDMKSFEQDEILNQSEINDTDTNQNPKDEIETIRIVFEQMKENIRKQIKSLKHSESLRRELVANISHDLKTPLTSLQGYIETLSFKRNLKEAEKLEYLSIAQKHCQRLEKLINELFEQARLELPDIKLNLESISPIEFFYDCVQKFQITAESKDIELKTICPEDAPYILIDIGLIERVLENLVENAIRHTPSKGKITVTVITNKDCLVVKVQDTGCGIPEKNLSSIFDRFFSERNKENNTKESSGLGLAITKRILELHNSTIDVESTVNEGTTFRFTLPYETENLLFNQPTPANVLQNTPTV